MRSEFYACLIRRETKTVAHTHTYTHKISRRASLGVRVSTIMEWSTLLLSVYATSDLSVLSLLILSQCSLIVVVAVSYLVHSDSQLSPSHRMGLRTPETQYYNIARRFVLSSISQEANMAMQTATMHGNYDLWRATCSMSHIVFGANPPQRGRRSWDRHPSSGTPQTQRGGDSRK